MLLTLWRGDQLLGELRSHVGGPLEIQQRPDKPPSISALLIPRVAPSELSGIMQVHFSEPFPAVHQSPVEPDIVAERFSRPEGTSSGPLRLLSPEEAKGVPRELQYHVGDADGRDYLPRHLSLRERRSDPVEHADQLRELPPEAVIGASVWTAFVVFASALEAPAG